jgi:hypothetical protein
MFDQEIPKKGGQRSGLDYKRVWMNQLILHRKVYCLMINKLEKDMEGSGRSLI